MKVLLILGLAPALWAVNPASVPEGVAGAKTVFLRNDTKDYKTFDYLRDKLGDMDRYPAGLHYREPNSRHHHH